MLVVVEMMGRQSFVGVEDGRNKLWALRKLILDAHSLSLQEKIQELEQEIDEITMEAIKLLRIRT